jgi:hypothetical protein
VVYWLKQHGIDPTTERVEAVFAAAKSADHVLTAAEIRKIVGAD